MTKTIMILAIAAAFVVGSIATGTIAFADVDDDGGGIQELVCDAGKAMTGIVSGGGDDDDGGGIIDILCATDAVNDADSDPSNEDQTLSGTGEVVLSTTEAGDGGGTVTCADITGGAGLCDGVDAVGASQQLVIEHLSVIYTDTAGITLTCTDANGIIIAFKTGSIRIFPGTTLGNGLNSVNIPSDQQAGGGNLVATAVCLSLQ